MNFLADVFMGLYFVVLGILAIYGSHRYLLVVLFLRHQSKQPKPKKKFKKLPRVTIQLPLYNEKYVVERLLDTISKIDYPRDLLDIQVLDDSTDDTVQIAGQKVKELQEQGLDIVHLHRVDRKGFKAGALEAGMLSAKGQLLMIFDADFMPRSNILKQCVHFFTDTQVGLVQVRWGHVNRHYSLLTEIQSILLDGHFIIEHNARNKSGRFFNFNGTAGIWRRQCIHDAGGWEHDTLTEDLDLSFRAQIKGWKFHYLQNVISPAELPVNMNAFKAQQHRWAKGSIQTSKKMLPVIWKSKIPLKAKIEGTFHLTNNLAYLLVVILAIILGPVVLIRHSRDMRPEMLYFWDIPLFITASLSVIVFYITAQRAIYKSWIPRLRYLPILLSLGIGLSVNNAKAVIEALIGHDTKFVRTPKFGIQSKQDRWANKQYRSKINFVPYAEVLLGLYITLYMVMTILNGDYATIPFLGLFQLGFLYVGITSLLEARQSRRPIKQSG